jgi:predicted transcriptional regulator
LHPEACVDLPERLLTPVELEIMNALWALGEGTVHDVLPRLAEERAYTTVSTLVRILEQKGFVASRKEGRHHVYVPTTPKPAYEAATLRDLVGRLFAGHPAALVRRLMSAEEVSADERAAIRRLLDESDR